jgi:hypothetical protein
MVYVLAIWYIVWAFYIFFFCFGMLCQEKSGNPALLDATWQFRSTTKLAFNWVSVLRTALAKIWSTAAT